jgi:hypothetical protein
VVVALRDVVLALVEAVSNADTSAFVPTLVSTDLIEHSRCVVSFDDR